MKLLDAVLVFAGAVLPVAVLPSELAAAQELSASCA